MKKDYKLRGWFPLTDAAKRLSADLGEEITVEDTMQIVIEGGLVISWQARQAFGQIVVPSATKGWQVLQDETPIVQMDGPYKLEFELCDPVADWIRSSLREPGEELENATGFFVSDREATLLQVMEYREGERYRIKNKWERLEGTYRPSSKFPQAADLVIQRRDIDEFEQSLGEVTPSKTRKWTPDMKQ